MAAKMVQKSPFMIPLSRVVTEISPMNSVVGGMLTYLCTKEAGGKKGKNRVIARKKKKPIAKIVLVADISVIPSLHIKSEDVISHISCLKYG